MILDILPIMGAFAKIIIILFALAAIGLVLFARYCFDDNDPDMFFHDNYDNMTNEHYAECHRPFVALKPNCLHQGEKTDVNVWVTCTCEEVHTICDDCGETLDKRTDC